MTDGNVVIFFRGQLQVEKVVSVSLLTLIGKSSARYVFTELGFSYQCSFSLIPFTLLPPITSRSSSSFKFTFQIIILGMQHA